jgi:succinate dehydrogenase hydrophobic anchor subunit
VLYVSFSLFLAVRVNTYYINFLKNKKEKYAHFNPDETTPYFNISNTRLILLSLITGGFYLMYWVYKKIKAVRDFQKDPVSPFWQAILLSFTSIHIFKAIAYSVKSLGYKEDLKPVGSALFVFLLTGLYGFEFNGQEGELLPLNLLMVTILFYWLMIALTICLFVKYQKAISFYATEKNIPCFCADLTVNPLLVEWNKNIASRIKTIPEMKIGILESNGEQNYVNWEKMCFYEPCFNETFAKCENGIYTLNEKFFEISGGIFKPSDYYDKLFN